MTTLIQARSDFGFYQVFHSIIRNALTAKQILGVATQSDQDEYDQHRYEGPTYIAGCIMHGVMMVPLLDSHPDGPFFERGVKTQILRGAAFESTLSDALGRYTAENIQQLWLKEMNDPQLDYDSSRIEEFNLIDNLGNVVASAIVAMDYIDYVNDEFDQLIGQLDNSNDVVSPAEVVETCKIEWRTPVASSEIPSLYVQASKLEDQAHEHRRSDSFFSASCSEEAARKLHVLASISGNQARLLT